MTVTVFEFKTNHGDVSQRVNRADYFLFNSNSGAVLFEISVNGIEVKCVCNGFRSVVCRLFTVASLSARALR